MSFSANIFLFLTIFFPDNIAGSVKFMILPYFSKYILTFLISKLLKIIYFQAMEISSTLEKGTLLLLRVPIIPWVMNLIRILASILLSPVDANTFLLNLGTILMSMGNSLRTPAMEIHCVSTWDQERLVFYCEIKYFGSYFLEFWDFLPTQFIRNVSYFLNFFKLFFFHLSKELSSCLCGAAAPEELTLNVTGADDTMVHLIFNSNNDSEVGNGFRATVSCVKEALTPGLVSSKTRTTLAQEH